MNLLAKFKIILLLLLTNSLGSYAQEYQLFGNYPGGKEVQTNNVFFLNDSCTFYVKNAVGDTVRFTSCEWSYTAQFADLTYHALDTVKNQISYHFKLDESIKDYSNSQLNRIIFDKDSAVCFSAKILLKGITDAGTSLSLEFPFYLNVLPCIPHMTPLEVIDQGTYSEEYGGYYYNGIIRMAFRTDRTKRYLVNLYQPGCPFLVSYYIDFDEDVSTLNFNFGDQDDEYELVAYNEFGAVENDFRFRFTDVILSIPEVEEENKFQVYPNPVKDDLYIEGETESVNKIEIINSQGQLVNRIYNPGNFIHFSSYSKGLYILKIETNTEKQEVIKILKK